METREEKIKRILLELKRKRDEIIDNYLIVLDNYEGHHAADTAGELKDIDRHIENLHVELKFLAIGGNKNG